MPLSEEEQRILSEIERRFYASDPKTAHQLSTTTLYRHAGRNCKWAAVGFVVAFALMKLFEASQIHDDIPKPAFKIRQTKRATFVLSTFAAVLSGLVWLLVQKLD